MIRISLPINCHGCSVLETPHRDGTAHDLDRHFSFGLFEIEMIQQLHDLGWSRDGQGHWFCEDCRTDALEAKAA
jgi:hypothetical protein